MEEQVSGQAEESSVTRQTGERYTESGGALQGAAKSSADRVRAHRERKRRAGYYTKGHVAGCPCPECLARRGFGDDSLIISEGESSMDVAAEHSETGMFYSADARRPKDVPYWDWFYSRHPEVADHRKG